MSSSDAFAVGRSVLGRSKINKRLAKGAFHQPLTQGRERSSVT